MHPYTFLVSLCVVALKLTGSGCYSRYSVKLGVGRDGLKIKFGHK